VKKTASKKKGNATKKKGLAVDFTNCTQNPTCSKKELQGSKKEREKLVFIRNRCLRKEKIAKKPSRG